MRELRGGEDLGLRDVFGGSRGVNSKSEIRNPKEIRNPRAEGTVIAGDEAAGGQSQGRGTQKRPAAADDKSSRTETNSTLEGSPWLAGPRLTRFASDPLDGRLGFKGSGPAWPVLELNRRANEDWHSRKRRKRPRAAPAGRRVLRT